MTVSEWIEQYRKQSDGRFETFKKALELLNDLKGTNIVETGTTRLENDWGGGMSTYLFGEYCRIFGGHLTTVDISVTNIIIAQKVTRDSREFIDYIINDSHAFLSLYDKPIDLLYLDSMDFPIDGSDPIPCQEHQLKELLLAEKNLKTTSLILLDDNQFIGGGKTKLTKEYLEKNGRHEVLGGQQSLWV